MFYRARNEIIEYTNTQVSKNLYFTDLLTISRMRKKLFLYITILNF